MYRIYAGLVFILCILFILLKQFSVLSLASGLAKGAPISRATFATMLSLKSYFFSFFWFSHRPGGGEANA